MTKRDPQEAAEAERRVREERLAKALRNNLRRRKASPTPPAGPGEPDR